MKILKLISEWKKKTPNSLKTLRKGYKRVEAIISEDGYIHTAHLDIPIEINIGENVYDKQEVKNALKDIKPIK